MQFPHDSDSNMALAYCQFRGILGEAGYPCDCAIVLTNPVSADFCSACPIPEAVRKGRLFGRRNATSASREPQIAAVGPGTEMKALLTELSLTPVSGCDCNARAAQMNQWGTIGCRENRDEIIGWLKDQQQKASWSLTVTAACKALGCTWFSILDPIGSIVDEAIRRAEAKL